MSDGRKGGAGDGCSLAERLPDSVINEILLKLDLETLCSAACACRTLRSSVSHAVSWLSSLDLSEFSPDTHILDQILHRFGKLISVAVDCLRLDDSSIRKFFRPHVQELILLKCSSLSYKVLASVGLNCPNLRAITLELGGYGVPAEFDQNLIRMLQGCLSLESLQIKIQGMEYDANGFMSIYAFLPKTVKAIKLQPMWVHDAVHFVHSIGNGSKNSDTPTSFLSPGNFSLNLERLSLVLDFITDGIIISIADSLPLLTALELEDSPEWVPSLPRDLTDSGLQSLSRCQNLTNLSLVRSRKNQPVSFKAISDMGLFLLSEGCKRLESLKLGGFSKVSDAGFASILNSNPNLKKFEIRAATLLSDLAFHDMSKVSKSFVEVKLPSCSNITSESVEELTCCSKLEVLDLFGCRSVADCCLGSVSRLNFLTSLNLGGADVTDSGMAVLGQGNVSVEFLGLRGCKRVTDKGISLLFCGGGEIRKTLSSLDLGYMPGISDAAIVTVAAEAEALSELCIRCCFYVTSASLKVLAMARRKILRRVDLYRCVGLSEESLELLIPPWFPGLKWVGIGLTRLSGSKAGEAGLCKIWKSRPWLTVCREGCEMGCHDGWQFHSLANFHE